MKNEVQHKIYPLSGNIPFASVRAESQRCGASMPCASHLAGNKKTKRQLKNSPHKKKKKEAGAKKKQTESKFVSSEFAWRPLACVVESVSPPEAKQIQPIIHTYETKECMYAPGHKHKISSYFTLVVSKGKQQNRQRNQN